MIAALFAVVVAASQWSYVGAAYGLTVVALLAYAAFVIHRGRQVGRQLPVEQRRWLK